MKRLRWSIVIVFQVLLVVTGALFPSASLSPVLSPCATDTPLVARVYVRNTEHLNAVAGELDIWEAHPEAGYVVTAITLEQQRWLEDLGYAVERDPRRTLAMDTVEALDPRFYYFNDEYPNPNGRHVVELLKETNAAYPNVTELIDIGDAWMAGQPNEPDRDILVLRISNEDSAYGAIRDKPAFFLLAATHAREVAASELAIRYLKYLTGGYDGEGGYALDPNVTWLVDHHVAYILVMQNPDGHVENERDSGSARRKNMDWDDGCTRPREWGVDLNRNHSFLWGCCSGSSGAPCRETYRGPGRGSEPETQAFERYFARVMEDQNGPNGDDEIPPRAPATTTGIFITLHTYGDLVLWPWGFDGYGDAPNQAELQTIGRKFAAFNGYSAAGTIWYDVDGATDDWTYGKFGIPSFTFEVGPQIGACGGFFPTYECIDGYGGRDFWAENKDAFLYAHSIARTPYRTVYGPDVQSTMFARNELAGRGLGRLTATIADHRCCGDTHRPVAGAEYFVDVPGQDGSGRSLDPLDGGWGDLTESVSATVDTSRLAPGQHTILLHGVSDDGHWGPFSAIFIEAGRRTYLPLIVVQ